MPPIKVMMYPHVLNVQQGESGIHTIIRKYAQHFHEYDIEMMPPDATSWDVLAVHAGTHDHTGEGAFVAHIHGLYWTADYRCANWEFRANQNVTDSIRKADIVTVPSEWVAETLKRDMRISPYIVPHGIDWQEWADTDPDDHDGYVLWNKNRDGDVCTTDYMRQLANAFPDVPFLSTFAPDNAPGNVKKTGLVPHETMKMMVKRAGVYLATTKETFGIGTLEAMAAGVPVLGFDHGGTAQLVQHGVNGYLARPGNMGDLANGLRYCVKYRKTLGENGKIIVQNYGWGNVIKMLRGIYEEAIGISRMDHDVTVVIPCFNKGETLEHAVRSAFRQNFQPKEVIVVDNNSTDASMEVAHILLAEYDNLRVIKEEKQGVAHARNRGRFRNCAYADE